jgi:hypothetical protein
MFNPGDAAPTGSMVFDICVSNYSQFGRQGLSRHGRRFAAHRHLRFTEAICHNGDHVIQFHHPRWRDDRNDSSTYIRVNGERVRR